ncbi:MAG: NAD(P)H-hydrate dehydratase [Cognatishimia sp.]
MTELLTAAQMRAIEQAAIEAGEVTGLALMERAGQGVVEAIFEEWPTLAADAVGGLATAVAGGIAADLAGGVAPQAETEFLPSPQSISEKVKRAVVLCGPGNNGGDGFVVARLLSERGWAVEVFLYGDADKLPPDARVNYERWCEVGVVSALRGDCLSTCICPDVLIDALFGTGLTRELPSIVLDVFHWLLHHRRDWKCDEGRAMRRLREKTVSVDIPTGVSSDTGDVFGAVSKEDEDLDQSEEPLAWPRGMARSIRADLTVTFHAPKIGHFIKMGPAYCGKVISVDIGIRGEGLERSFGLDTASDPERVRLLEPVFNSQRLPSKCFISGFLGKNNGHKFSYGHALILSGAAGQTGAARLAARGALRIGAGVVTLGVPRGARGEVAAHVTAIMQRSVDYTKDLLELLKDKRINALCLGPALGLERAKALVMAALETGVEKRPMVLDADALSAFEAAPEDLFDLLHADCVLTPHGGEFARLFPDISEKLKAVPTKGPAYSKVDATREAAQRAGCVVLFKGADTVIAAPDGRCSINSAQYERAVPWLATAGAGDVLAGFITGLMARGVDAMQAAETAAWLHVECARKFGPGLIAEDLPEQLPVVFRDLDL